MGKYPITKEQFGFVNNLMAFTAIEDKETVGFFTMRISDDSFDELRFGFVIVDPDKRGKGYGKSESYNVLGEEWNCRELEILLNK